MNITIKGPDGSDIPSGTSYRIEAYGVTPKDGKVLVAEGVCTKSINEDLDPGKYVVVMSKTNKYDPRQIDFYHITDFIHGATAPQYEKMKYLRPKHSRSVMTSDGPRYNCGIGGCEFFGTTAYATVKHEAEHQGFDLEKPDDLARYLGDVPAQPKKALVSAK